MGSQANLGLATAVMGAGTKAIGAYNAASSESASLNYQASVSRNNAILAQDKATIAENNGVIAVQNQGLKLAQIEGMQKANLGANGVVLDNGSAANLINSTQMMGQRDMEQIQTNALREAWGYTTQANDLNTNARTLDSMNKSISPGSDALSSLVGSAKSVSSAWRTYKTTTDGGTTTTNPYVN